MKTIVSIFMITVASKISFSQEKLSFDSLKSLSTLGSLDLNDQGTEILYTLNTPDLNTERSKSTIWKVNLADSNAIKLSNDNNFDHSAKWSPDGELVAFLSNRSDNGMQIWLMNNNGEDVREISNIEGSILLFDWSPDGTKLGVIYRKRREDNSGQVAQLVEGQMPNELLALISLDNGETRLLFDEPKAGLSFSWSPSSSEIAFSEQKKGGFYGGFESDIFLIDLNSSSINSLVKRPGMDRNPLFSPSGNKLAFLSNYGTPGGLLPNIGVSIIDLRTKSINDIGKQLDKGGFFEGPVGIQWHPENKSVFYNVSFGLTVKIVEAELASNKLNVLTKNEKSFGRIRIAKKVNKIAFTSSDYSNPDQIYISSLDNFHPQQISNFNAEFKRIIKPTAEAIFWQSKDGTEISGLLVKPPNFDDTKTYPLLTYLHGGPSSSIGFTFPTFDFYNPLRDDLLASNGHIVFIPNFRGSGGFGYNFRSAIKSNWGDLPLSDVLSGIEKLKERNYIDGNALGLMGWSFGGYLTAYAITQTSIFKVAVMGAGIMDLRSHFTMLPEQMIEYFDGPPWDDKVQGSYIRNSPLTHSENIKTPVLIIHGENDTAVSIDQGALLKSVLTELNIPHEFARYPDQGHSFFGDEVRQESYSRVLNWINKWIK